MVINQKGDTMIGLGNYEKLSEEEVKQDIIDTYCANADLANKFEVLIAWSGDDGGYEEYSFFLLRDKETKELFENHASHCSCAGFEGQFEPQATTIAYLKSEHFHSTGWDTVDEAVKSFVNSL